MIDRPTGSAPRQAKRRPSRFRAAVERLDSRQLFAVGVTGTTASLTGTAGSPLPSSNFVYPDLPASDGGPVLLVTLTNPNADIAAAGYSAAVNWGDGSLSEAASLLSALPPPESSGHEMLFVDGADHTYQTPGTFAVSVSVTGPGDVIPTIYHGTATISAPGIAITGQLNPLSDSGYSDGDGITAIDTPNFIGTTQPGASVVLTALNLSDVAAGFSTIGSGTADAAGHWTITSTPLADGFYSIYATTTGKFGATTGTYIEPGALYNGLTLSIDTGGPKIAGFQVIDARKGTFQVGFTDPYGLLIGPLVNPTNYTARRPSPTPRKGQKFPVATLFSSTVTLPNNTTTTNNPVLVTGTLSTGKPIITKNGVYTFTIHAAGIISLSGATLDGEFLGKFPTGNGVAGGDFQVRVNVRNGKASGPIVVTPVKLTAHPGKAKVAAVKHHA